jgi:hypothetical protein
VSPSRLISSRKIFIELFRKPTSFDGQRQPDSSLV